MLKDSFKLKIYSDRLKDNYNYLSQKSKKEIIAVVKANAYGLGLKNIIPILWREGCRYFAVSRINEIEEILELKLEGIKIILLEVLEDFSLLKRDKNLEMIVTDLQLLKRLVEEGVDTKQLHLRFDFGFARSGIGREDIKELLEFINEKDIYFRGGMGHLFSASESDMRLIEREFDKLIKKIGRERFEVIHLQNSEGAEIITSEISTHIRSGTALLGMQELDRYNPNIKKVFELKGKIFDIREITELKYIGYSKKENLKLDGYSRVGQIKFGYADGFLKEYENHISIINNKKFRVVHISMDVSFIAVDESVQNGDTVEIFKNYKEISKCLRRSLYEVMVILNNRKERER